MMEAVSERIIDHNEKMYLATMHMAKTLLWEEVITREDYEKINTKFTEKYRPCLGSLLFDNKLIQPGDRSNIDQ